MPRSTAALLATLLLFLASEAAAVPTVVEIATTAPDTLVVVVEQDSDEAAPLTTPAAYLVNGATPLSVGRWSYVWWQGVPAAGVMRLRHHLYLRLQAPLAEGADYVLASPYGTRGFEFQSATVRAESLKVNQAGYATGNGSYAVLAPWAGDLGHIDLATPPPYRVVDAAGVTMQSGIAADHGLDLVGPVASGDHVHRLALDGVPDGGPYRIVVDGLGASHPFFVGAAASRGTSYTVVRGLYHQRCGIALEAAFTAFTRNVCHAVVQVTDAEPPGFIAALGPPRPIAGGYHDAGDFDRRPFHTLIPAWMLTLFDAYPAELANVAFDLPESSNAIPDWLDEALWGLKVWEMLQEPDGGVRAGTEADRHPTFGEVAADTDTLIYRTYRVDGHATASAAGLFAQASRLVRPYDAARAAGLLERASRAWQYVELHQPATARPAQRMYAALHLYLATGEPAYHDAFRNTVDALDGAGWPQQYHTAYFSLDTVVNGEIFSPYFAPYLWTSRETDAATRATLRGWLDREVAAVMAADASRAYPTGNAPNAAWGSLTSQGRYADALIYAYRIEPRPAWWHAISRLRDYALGLNPLGKSFVTGLGANPPQTPLHLDSYFTAQRGLGPVPGITLFGPFHTPSQVAYQKIVWEQAYPAWSSLPPARRHSEGWSLVPVNEFSTTETMAQNAVMHAFVAHVANDALFVSSFE